MVISASFFGDLTNDMNTGGVEIWICPRVGDSPKKSWFTLYTFNGTQLRDRYLLIFISCIARPKLNLKFAAYPSSGPKYVKVGDANCYGKPKE